MAISELEEQLDHVPIVSDDARQVGALVAMVESDTWDQPLNGSSSGAGCTTPPIA